MNEIQDIETVTEIINQLKGYNRKKINEMLNEVGIYYKDTKEVID